MSLKDKTVLITGGARRIGRELALAAASIGANVIIHHAHSPLEAEHTAAEIRAAGCVAWTLEADLGDLEQAASLIDRAWTFQPLYALVNSAAIFEPISFKETTLEQWQKHLDLNLSAPFLLSQAFGKKLPAGNQGRIINILDWRALRPGADHFPYTISKAGLAEMTKSMAAALAPDISVNGLALGAILPPSTGGSPDILKNIPAKRWATLDELHEAIQFLLQGPAYITGEILHLDGGRHLI
jgi:NAD(P)-dependent dehydrogenase (short-subunit alcohol dehydrogenase family)